MASFTAQDVHEMAEMMIAEASSEGWRGMADVGYAAYNRSELTGKSISETINHYDAKSGYAQFSYQTDAANMERTERAIEENAPIYIEATRLAGDILTGQSAYPNHGGTYYHKTNMEKPPDWRHDYDVIEAIDYGNHIFYGGPIAASHITHLSDIFSTYDFGPVPENSPAIQIAAWANPEPVNLFGFEDLVEAFDSQGFPISSAMAAEAPLGTSMESMAASPEMPSNQPKQPAMMAPGIPQPRPSPGIMAPGASIDQVSYTPDNFPDVIAGGLRGRSSPISSPLGGVGNYTNENLGYDSLSSPEGIAPGLMSGTTVSARGAANPELASTPAPVAAPSRDLHQSETPSIFDQREPEPAASPMFAGVPEASFSNQAADAAPGIPQPRPSADAPLPPQPRSSAAVNTPPSKGNIVTGGLKGAGQGFIAGGPLGAAIGGAIGAGVPLIKRMNRTSGGAPADDGPSSWGSDPISEIADQSYNADGSFNLDQFYEAAAKTAFGGGGGALVRENRVAYEAAKRTAASRGTESYYDYSRGSTAPTSGKSSIRSSGSDRNGGSDRNDDSYGGGGAERKESEKGMPSGGFDPSERTVGSSNR